MKDYLKSKSTSDHNVDDRQVLDLISMVKEGVSMPYFMSFVKTGPFTLKDWSRFLHISLRTIQRHQKQNRPFQPLQSEKVLQIALLSQKGREVFGSAEAYHKWLDSTSIALGGRPPKDLLDSAFGIGMVHDELVRIEHGVLA